jgi:hypothetical protein
LVCACGSACVCVRCTVSCCVCGCMRVVFTHTCAVCVRGGARLLERLEQRQQHGALFDALDRVRRHPGSGESEGGGGGGVARLKPARDPGRDLPAHPTAALLPLLAASLSGRGCCCRCCDCCTRVSRHDAPTAEHTQPRPRPRCPPAPSPPPALRPQARAPPRPQTHAPQPTRPAGPRLLLKNTCTEGYSGARAKSAHSRATLAGEGVMK